MIFHEFGWKNNDNIEMYATSSNLVHYGALLYKNHITPEIPTQIELWWENTLTSRTSALLIAVGYWQIQRYGPPHPHHPIILAWIREGVETWLKTLGSLGESKDTKDTRPTASTGSRFQHMERPFEMRAHATNKEALDWSKDIANEAFRSF